MGLLLLLVLAVALSLPAILWCALLGLVVFCRGLLERGLYAAMFGLLAFAYCAPLVEGVIIAWQLRRTSDVSNTLEPYLLVFVASVAGSLLVAVGLCLRDSGYRALSLKLVGLTLLRLLTITAIFYYLPIDSALIAILLLFLLYLVNAWYFAWWSTRTYKWLLAHPPASPQPIRSSMNWRRLVAASIVVAALGAGLYYITRVPAWTIGINESHHLQTITLGRYESAAFSADETLVALATTRGEVFIWQLSDNTLRQTLEIGTSIESIAFSPDGQVLAIAGYNGELTLRGVEDSSMLGNVAVSKPNQDFLRGHPSRIVFSPDGHMLAWAGPDDQVHLWDVKTAKLASTLEHPHKQPINNVAWSPDGTYLAASSDDGTLVLWNMPNRQVRLVIDAHLSARSLAFVPHSDLLISGGSERRLLAPWDVKGVIKVWRITDGALQRSFVADRQYVNQLVVHPDGRLLASNGADSLIWLWDLTSGARHEIRPVSEPTLAISPSGRSLAIGNLFLPRYLSIWQIDPFNAVAR